jgi:hypothetical protein
MSGGLNLPSGAKSMPLISPENTPPVEKVVPVNDTLLRLRPVLGSILYSVRPSLLTP